MINYFLFSNIGFEGLSFLQSNFYYSTVLIVKFNRNNIFIYLILSSFCK